MDNTSQIMSSVGPGTAADGASVSPRLAKTREMVVATAHGQYFENAGRGNMFMASTAVGGVAPGTALSTTPPMAVWNPLGSGVLISIEDVFIGYVSGTLGAGTMVHAQVLGQNTVPASGTELAPVCALLNGTKGKARAFQGSTLVATPTIVRPSIVLGAGLATTAVLPQAPAQDWVEGGIVIPPGSVWVYQGVAAAGTSPLVLIGVTYEEVPIS